MINKPPPNACKANQKRGATSFHIGFEKRIFSLMSASSERVHIELLQNAK